MLSSELRARWESCAPGSGWSTAQFSDLLCAAVDDGHYSVAQDLAGTALHNHPGELELRYLQALSPAPLPLETTTASGTALR